MKVILVFVVALLAVFWAIAFPKPGATLRQAKQPAIVGMDRTFASDAAMGNMAEVQLGQLAQEKGTSEFTKQFGAMMVKDHSGALSELKNIAADKNIVLPSALNQPSQANYNRLSGLNGAAFDEAFRSVMMKDHQAAVKRFASYAAKGRDAELRAFASKYLAPIQRHLQIIKAGHM